MAFEKKERGLGVLGTCPAMGILLVASSATSIVLEYNSKSAFYQQYNLIYYNIVRKIQIHLLGCLWVIEMLRMSARRVHKRTTKNGGIWMICRANSVVKTLPPHVLAPPLPVAVPSFWSNSVRNIPPPPWHRVKESTAPGVKRSGSTVVWEAGQALQSIPIGSMVLLYMLTFGDIWGILMGSMIPYNSIPGSYGIYCAGIVAVFQVCSHSIFLQVAATTQAIWQRTSMAFTRRRCYQESHAESPGEKGTISFCQGWISVFYLERMSVTLPRDSIKYLPPIISVNSGHSTIGWSGNPTQTCQSLYHHRDDCRKGISNIKLIKTTKTYQNPGITIISQWYQILSYIYIYIRYGRPWLCYSIINHGSTPLFCHPLLRNSSIGTSVQQAAHHLAEALLAGDAQRRLPTHRGPGGGHGHWNKGWTMETWPWKNDEFMDFHGFSQVSYGFSRIPGKDFWKLDVFSPKCFQFSLKPLPSYPSLWSQLPPQIVLQHPKYPSQHPFTTLHSYPYGHGTGDHSTVIYCNSPKTTPQISRNCWPCSHFSPPCTLW